MIKPRIIVTGATGKTGNVVIAELRKAGYPVRALVRREDGRRAQLKEEGRLMSGPPPSPKNLMEGRLGIVIAVFDAASI